VFPLTVGSPFVPEHQLPPLLYVVEPETYVNPLRVKVKSAWSTFAFSLVKLMVRL